jgi:hydrogenase maturation factor
MTGPVCITCGDVAVPMRVMRIDPEAGLALCATEAGETSEVEVGLVDPVGEGDTLLVHACVALQRLG